MPWRPGQPRPVGYQNQFTDAEEQMLEEAYLTLGIREGQTALYKRLREQEGDNAPTREEVANWLRARPESQIARMPVKDNAVAPVLPRGDAPLSLVFADTMMMPPTSHDGGPGVGRKLFRAIVVYVDALTKFATLHGVFQLVAGRPQSSQTAEGAREFIRQARDAMNYPDADEIHVRRWVTDKGSEWLRGPLNAGFENWNDAQALAHPGFYQHAKTPGTRSSYNSIAEVTIKTIRRLYYGKYRAWVREQDDLGVPARNRRFNWMAFLEDVQDTYNSGYRSTIKTTPIKAIDATQEPTYGELQRRIVAKAVKRYGRRAQLDEAASIPGFSAYGLLQVGDYVRKKRWKDGGGTAALRWSRIDNKSSDNNYSEEIFTVLRVNPGQGMKRTTYAIESLDNVEQPGNWSREQLLGPLPAETFNNLSGSESEEDDDDDGDGAVAADTDDEEEAPPDQVDPRPPKGDDYRYKARDRLQFNANWFGAGQFRDLVAPIRRARVGMVLLRQVRRARAVPGRRAAPGVKSYLIQWETGEPNGFFPRDEIDDDDDVQFIDGG